LRLDDVEEADIIDLPACAHQESVNVSRDEPGTNNPERMGALRSTAARQLAASTADAAVRAAEIIEDSKQANGYPQS